MQRQLYTPEGVRDIYCDECSDKNKMIRRLTGLISSYGYQPISTPTFEFFDVFSKEIGTTASADLYKFIDREGNTLVLRPDFTPSIARSVSSHFTDEEMPVRLYYEGSVFRNNTSYQGRLKESTQLGAELIGEHSIASDAEIIAMAVKTLRRAGLKDFQISISHTDILTGLFEDTKMDEKNRSATLDYLLNKNFFGLEEFLTSAGISRESIRLFLMLSDMYDCPRDFAGFAEAAKDSPKVCRALSYLSELDDLLAAYGVSDFVSYEVGLVSHLRYYTGIIFSGYTYGSGEPIVSGGRYDRLLSNFGRDLPAIGFALALDDLLTAMERQKIAPQTDRPMKEITYHDSDNNEELKKAVVLACDLRKKGENVRLRRIENS